MCLPAVGKSSKARLICFFCRDEKVHVLKEEKEAASNNLDKSSQLHDALLDQLQVGSYT